MQIQYEFHIYVSPTLKFEAVQKWSFDCPLMWETTLLFILEGIAPSLEKISLGGKMACSVSVISSSFICN